MTDENKKAEDEALEEINLDEIPEVEAGTGFDFEEFTGTKKKIENIRQMEVKTDYNESGDFSEGLQRKVQVLKIETEVVTEFEDKEKNKKPIRASELFNMKKNEEGKWGISKSVKAKIRKFMNRQKVTKLKELIGTSVIIKDYTDKKGNTYLGYVIE